MQMIKMIKKLKRDLHTHLKVEPSMMVSGEVKSERGMDSKFVLKYYLYFKGPMEQDMKVNGKTIKLVVRGNFGMLMVIFMKDNGKMIKLMVLVFIST